MRVPAYLHTFTQLDSFLSSFPSACLVGTFFVPHTHQHKEHKMTIIGVITVIYIFAFICVCGYYALKLLD